MTTYNDKANSQASQIYDMSGIDDPTIIATQAAAGTTYKLIRTGSPKLFIKIDEGKTTNWLDISSGGNVGGVNLGTGAQILKNLLANVLYFRSLKGSGGIVINQLADEIEIVGAGAQGCVAFDLQTNSSGFTTIYSHSVGINTVQKLDINILTRKADGTAHAMFDRVAMVFNESGVLQEIRPWTTSNTYKSDPNIDVKYVLSGANFEVQVKA